MQLMRKDLQLQEHQSEPRKDVQEQQRRRGELNFSTSSSIQTKKYTVPHLSKSSVCNEQDCEAVDGNSSGRISW